MIDIIIPCHNSHDTIDRCIGSILSQRVYPSIHITLVNDAGKNYDEVIKRYSPILDIKEITYDKNGGPAKARNYGLKNTNKPFIMFIDSDDCLGDPYTVINMCNVINKKGSAMAIGDFIEEIRPLMFKRHSKDTSFMHGKIYNRQFLEKYNILQNENSRCNEDVGFNILAMLIAKHNKLDIAYTDLISYYWLYNPSSIVRSDKENFDHSTSFRGFADNLRYVFEELNKRGYDSLDILLEKITTMQRLFLLYRQKSDNYPQFKEDNLKHVKMYYDSIYKHIENKVTSEMFDHVYNNIIKNNFTKEQVRQFIEALK